MYILKARVTPTLKIWLRTTANVYMYLNVPSSVLSSLSHALDHSHSIVQRVTYHLPRIFLRPCDLRDALRLKTRGLPSLGTMAFPTLHAITPIG